MASSYDTHRGRLRHILLILLDGVGLPPGRLEDSVYRHCPALCRLFGENSVPLDTGLGVPGITQSATGQTAILTGVNAAALLGRHLEGFPNSALRDVITANNVFRRLLERHRTCQFANAYVSAPAQELPVTLRSVTTVSTLAAFGQALNRADLLDGRAVYHDITRHTLPTRGIEGIPPIREPEAAKHLLGVLRTVDFCLFEYFLTDHAGHRGTPEDQQRVLQSLDAFVDALLAGLDGATELLLMVSDHGNIEDGSRRGHTSNPVPWVARGCAESAARHGCASLLDVTPKVLELLGAE